MIAEESRLAERFGAPRALAMARRAGAHLHRGAARIALLRSAVELLDGCGARVDHARALLDLGAAIRRDGRPAAARSVLREAIVAATRCGASGIAASARDELHVAGGRMRPELVQQIDPLTAGERRVVDLARQGHTNRQIANTLFITVKAVEWHLSNGYRKLGVRNRSELAAADVG